jgi:hypothetical protein
VRYLHEAASVQRACGATGRAVGLLYVRVCLLDPALALTTARENAQRKLGDLVPELALARDRD